MRLVLQVLNFYRQLYADLKKLQLYDCIRLVCQMDTSYGSLFDKSMCRVGVYSRGRLSWKRLIEMERLFKLLCWRLHTALLLTIKDLQDVRFMRCLYIILFSILCLEIWNIPFLSDLIPNNYWISNLYLWKLLPFQWILSSPPIRISRRK